MPTKARIQIRRDTSANWLAAPPIVGRGILREGELGFEIDTGLIKVGDGATPWATLAYLSGGPSSQVVTVQGAQGAQGPQGVQGIQGVQGSQGAQGAQGAQGNQGLQGTQGIQGAQGAQGGQGTQGLQGTQGAQGVQGAQGAQGTQGQQGTQGLQGTQGAQGVQGAQGAQGTQGTQGTQGIQGVQGSQGHQGPQGTQGVQGAQGAQGIQGAQGTQGTQGVQGVQGAQGAQGTQGQQGTQGLQGATLKYATTSTTSHNVTTLGSKTFNVDTGLGYTAGQGYIAFYDTNNYSLGTVTSYNTTIGTLVVNATNYATDQPAGTSFGSWTININGLTGPQGLQGIAGSGVAIGGSANQIIYKDGSGNTTGNVDFTFEMVGGIEPMMSVPIIEIPSTTVSSATNKLYNFASKLQWSGGMDLGGAFTAVSKSFDIPHPSKKTGRLVYGSLESPYHGVRLTGRETTKNGKCVIKLPKYIRDLVKEEDCAVYLSNYGHGKVLYTENIDISKNTITIKVAEPTKGEELEFFWDFTAIRKDIPDLIVEP